MASPGHMEQGDQTDGHPVLSVPSTEQLMPWCENTLDSDGQHEALYEQLRAGLAGK